MEHAHQLVKVTNFMLHLMLLLPLQTTTTTSSSSSSGGSSPVNSNTLGIVGTSGVVGKSSTEFAGPIGAITSGGRERSHLKGVTKDYIVRKKREELGTFRYLFKNLGTH
uniref:Uncharacterized protein n=1 Tax=Anopheles culicifacies TaxID=139723 RepID=A0A182M3H6_9DIPT